MLDLPSYFLELPAMTQADAIILAAEFDEVFSRRPRSPEEKLLFAVLEDAVGILCEPKLAGRGWERVRESTAAWIQDTEDDGVFSFSSIWAALFPDFDVDVARREILDNPREIWARVLKMRREK